MQIEHTQLWRKSGGIWLQRQASLSFTLCIFLFKNKYESVCMHHNVVCKSCGSQRCQWKSLNISNCSRCSGYGRGYISNLTRQTSSRETHKTQKPFIHYLLWSTRAAHANRSPNVQHLAWAAQPSAGYTSSTASCRLVHGCSSITNGFSSRR